MISVCTEIENYKLHTLMASLLGEILQIMCILLESTRANISYGRGKMHAT